MKDKNITWNQLVRYMGEESSPEEQKVIRQWIKSNPEHEVFISYIRKIWDSPAEKKQDWNVDMAWNRFQAEYGEAFLEDAQSDKSASHITKEQPHESASQNGRVNGFRIASWGAVAAAIGAIIVMIFLTYEPLFEMNEKPPVKEIITQNGERAHFRLSDGSHIVLNAGSILWVPETFSGNERRIELSGEAYFEVASDPQKPFVVYTEKATTQVLGTKFGIKAYSDNEQTQVVVVEGKVELRPKNTPAGFGAKITKLQRGVLHSKETTIFQIKDTAPYLGWTEGHLVFDNDSIVQIIAGLERWYDVKVKVEDPNLNSLQFTGRFTARQPLDEVLDAIALSLGISYTRQDTTIIFHNKNTN